MHLHLIINCKRHTDYPLSTLLTTVYAYRMPMTNVNMNVVSTEPVTMLMVHVLIDGKEILLHVLQNEDVAKGVLMCWMHVEPRSVQALNETTFLVTYASGILSDEIGSAVEKIEDWLGNQWLSHVMR